MNDDVPSVSDPVPQAAPGALTAVQLGSAVLAGISLAGCGGGGSAATSGSSDANTPPVVPIVPVVPPTQNEAARFLSQAAFGGNTSDLNTVIAQGYATWINNQFNLPADQKVWDWMVAQGYTDISNIYNDNVMDAAIWQKLITSPNVLQQRIALALSEIFVVGIAGLPIGWRNFAIAAYMDMLNANAFGNFRSLLEAVTLSPAMGVFLGTRGNIKANPATGSQADENYGREIMQLFTIGLYQLNNDGTLKLDSTSQPVETYSLNDITQIAKVFTGWDFTNYSATAPTHLQLPMSLTASKHSTDAKSFLGITIAAGGDGLSDLKTTLDTLFNHPNAAPFFSKQLIQRLVTSNPSPAYVQRVANVFISGDGGVRGDMKSVIRAVLLDTEARSPDPGLTNYGKLREPMIRLVQWARTFGATSPSGLWAIGDTSDPGIRLGQSPFRSATVFNFFRPGYVPGNNALGNPALVAPEFQLVNESTVVAYLNFMQTVIPGKLADITPNYSTELAMVNDTAGLLAHLNTVLASGNISATDLATIQSAISSIAVTTNAGQLNRISAALMLIMCSVDYLLQK